LLTENALKWAKQRQGCLTLPLDILTRNPSTKTQDVGKTS